MVLPGGGAVVDMKLEVPGEYTLGSCAVAGGSWLGGKLVLKGENRADLVDSDGAKRA